MGCWQINYVIEAKINKIKDLELVHQNLSKDESEESDKYCLKFTVRFSMNLKVVNNPSFSSDSHLSLYFAFPASQSVEFVALWLLAHPWTASASPIALV